MATTRFRKEEVEQESEIQGKRDAAWEMVSGPLSRGPCLAKRGHGDRRLLPRRVPHWQKA
jgi:hypothetical protein